MKQNIFIDYSILFLYKYMKNNVKQYIRPYPMFVHRWRIDSIMRYLIKGHSNEKFNLIISFCSIFVFLFLAWVEYITNYELLQLCHNDHNQVAENWQAQFHKKYQMVIIQMKIITLISLKEYPERRNHFIFLHSNQLNTFIRWPYRYHLVVIVLSQRVLK